MTQHLERLCPQLICYSLQREDHLSTASLKQFAAGCGYLSIICALSPFPGSFCSLTSLKPSYEALGSPLSKDLRPGKKYWLAAIVSASLRGNSVNFLFFIFNSYSFFLDRLCLFNFSQSFSFTAV